jgi:predicted ester cyclase
VTKDELAAFYRRYNACCNAHGFEDFREFVADDVVINGTDRGLDAYTGHGLPCAAPSAASIDRVP